MVRAALTALVVLMAMLAAGPGHAATPTAPVYDSKGRLIGVPFVPPAPAPTLDEDRVLALARAHPKIAAWLERYPEGGLTEEATFDDERKQWTVKVWSDLPDAGQIVLATVDDATARVTAAWTGPQVAWSMARGAKGAFGRTINEPWVWWPLLAVFLLGLANLRRPFSLRNLDLLVLASFSLSWWFFNQGEIFTSVPLAYPPLLYLLARMAWIGARGRGPGEGRPLWPVWLLAAATLFLVGFRFSLNLVSSNVIDVGYAGVIGAQRIVDAGESPYGHMPLFEGEECGPADAAGNVRERIQTNGRCESANPRGDTYGPVTYIAYIPGFLATGWSGKWDSLPAAHFAALTFDGVALIGLALVGWRYGRARLAVTLPFAWAAYPFTQYVSSSNSNDTLLPALLIIGFWLAGSAPARGLFTGLASWAKFAALPLVPLWLSYPGGLRRPRALAAFGGGFVLAAALAFWVLLLEPDPLHAGRVFWDRTFGWQLGRDSPFSLWNWGKYPGYPDLSALAIVLQSLLAIGALVVAVRPRRKSPLQLAALSAALLIGFEIALQHWFYLYIVWFLPFVAYAVLTPSAGRAEEPVEDADERETRDLAGAAA